LLQNQADNAHTPARKLAGDLYPVSIDAGRVEQSSNIFEKDGVTDFCQAPAPLEPGDQAQIINADPFGQGYSLTGVRSALPAKNAARLSTTS
jgi:hypothetical protein